MNINPSPKLLTILTALAIILAGGIVGFGPLSVNASTAGCGAGSNQPTYYQLQSGIFDCGNAPVGHPHPEYFYRTRLADYIKCVKRVDSLDGTDGNNKPQPSSAWFATYAGSASGANAGASLYCRGDGLAVEHIGEAYCADWMQQGPGTGPGMNPQANLAECLAWARDAFFSGSFNPTQLGVPIQCNAVGYCSQTGDSNPATRGLNVPIATSQ